MRKVLQPPFLLFILFSYTVEMSSEIRLVSSRILPNYDPTSGKQHDSALGCHTGNMPGDCVLFFFFMCACVLRRNFSLAFSK